MMNNMIDPRKHCMVAYNLLSELNKVKSFPSEISSMPQDTAKELFNKLNAVMTSEYYKNLPLTCNIVMSSGKMFLWEKDVTTFDYNSLWNEVKNFLT